MKITPHILHRIFAVSIFLLSILLSPRISAAPPSGFNEAISLLDASPLSPIEGIWYNPDDETTFLVLNQPASHDFDIFILQSPDCRLLPGLKVGSIHPSVDPSRFRLSMMSKYKKGQLSNPINISAKLSNNDSSLILESQKVSISLSPSIILPKLFNILRLGIRLKISDPTSKIPYGWQKIHPLPPSPQIPIYL